MTFKGSALGRNVAAAAATILIILVLSVPSAHAQFPELVVQVGDTTGPFGQKNTVISIFMDNFQDTVAGFNIWLQLGRPDIMIFQTDSATVVDTSYWDCLAYEDDTVCVDSVKTNPLGDWDYTIVDTNDIAIGSWDTSGTLISGWQKVDARSISVQGNDLNIVGIANMPEPPFVHGIAPQQGGTPLIKLLADVLEDPPPVDTTNPDTNWTVDIFVQYDFIDHFSFSKPDGSLIGIYYDTVPDTNYYICTQWAGDVCLNWKRVSTPPADSIEPHLDTAAFIDTSVVIVDHGSLTAYIPEGICGDCDGSGTFPPNVADLTFLVDYLFKGGPEPNPLWVANVDCTGGPVPNVADLSYLVNYLFKGGPDPCAAGCGP